jgi:hypothetical protein
MLPTVEEKAKIEFEAPEPLKIDPPDDPLGARRDAEIDAISAQLAKDLRDAGHLLERELLDIVRARRSTRRT